ncbi:MAG: D-alanyl-D-alanine carboxypeptidase [Mycobacterium sp.]|jgi:D-alanyl-D-alanine carboxypeptidase|nr:D-alanyl-D-alanine carboxypeptidase [Mycobacterium sp.]
MSSRTALLLRAVGAVAAVIVVTACGSQASVPEAPNADAHALPAATQTRLDDAIKRAMSDAAIPGVMVGIWSPAGDYVRSFGLADKTTNALMRTDFYSRIGSVTKTFTVTALLQLVDAGKLRLDDAVADYIAGVPAGGQITLRELAQMRSGLKTYDDVPELANAFTADPERSFTPQELMGYVLDKPLEFAPGSQYQYSNTNTVLLGLVIEKQSGQHLADYIREHILDPLALAHTSFPLTADFHGPHPQGYTDLNGQEVNATDWNPSWGWAAGNMISTLDDMRVWAKALATGTLLTPEMQRQRLDTISPMNPEQTAFYGLGIFNAAGWLGHSGSVFGYQSVVVYLPEAQTTLVCFINTDVPHDASTTLARAITTVISPDHVYR